MDDEEQKQRNIRLLHKLATRLPWIVVIVTVFTALVTFLQIYLSRP
jgi:hypothetical protein